MHEQHTDHTGFKHDHIYIAQAGADINLAAELRAQVMGTEIDRREAAALEAENFILPFSKYEFLNLFTQAERLAIRTAAKNDVVIEDFLSLLSEAPAVYLTNPDVIAGINYFVQAELLTQDRATEVLNG
ncbi:hypothetical protein [Methylobacter marinus]|uniref:hypothetical protein n=1 Tax=Methylobacter marinus TaxID=34058 RepID=UPI0003A0AE26|nr:hypothetical protein [Methylobacter marinus]